MIYEPWSVFSDNPQDAAAADVAVTGEEYVLLSLLEVLLTVRAEGESMRSAFLRARDSGALDGIPGLVYSRTDARGVAEELVDTGIQRLLGDFDELPHAVLGYRLLEPPSRAGDARPEALPAHLVRKHSRVASVVLTQGCRFRCTYCPIPAYNQRQSRGKSGQRLADEIGRIYNEYDIRFFFGTDDNFLGDRQRALEIGEALARKVDAGSRPHCKVRWATEATVHDVLKMREHLPLLRKAGLWGLWLGVEDMTAALVQQGPGRRSHAGSLQGPSPERDLSRADAHAPRCPAAFHLAGQRGPAQSTGSAAKSRLAVYADPDVHACVGLEIVRRELHLGHDLPERRRGPHRAEDPNRNARDRLAAPAPLDQAAQPPGGLRLVLQPATVLLGAGCFQEPDSPGRRPHVAAAGATPTRQSPFPRPAQAQTACAPGRRLSCSSSASGG